MHTALHQRAVGAGIASIFLLTACAGSAATDIAGTTVSVVVKHSTEQLQAASLTVDDVPGTVQSELSGFGYPCSDVEAFSDSPRSAAGLLLRVSGGLILTRFADRGDPTRSWSEQRFAAKQNCRYMHGVDYIEHVEHVRHEASTAVDKWTIVWSAVASNGSTSSGIDRYYQVGTTVGAMSCTSTPAHAAPSEETCPSAHAAFAKKLLDLAISAAPG